MAKKGIRSLITFGDKSKAELLAEKLTFAVSIILLILSFIPQFELARDILRMISVVLAAYPAVEDMFEGVSKKKISETLFLIIAIFATWITGEFAYAALIAIIYRVCRWLLQVSKRIALGKVSSLGDMTVESAHLILETGDTESIDSKDIKKGMKLRVLPRETIPVDCVIAEGKTTAESFDSADKEAIRIAKAGDKLSAGSKNGSATISVEALVDASDSKIEKIIGIVNTASDEKSETEEKISNTMKYVSAIAATAAVATGVIGSLVTGYPGTWIRNAVVILTASFVSSAVAMVPVPFISCLARKAKDGTVIRSPKSIEKMSGADTVVLDNPGMIASDELTAGEIFAEPGYGEDDILSLVSEYAEETDNKELKMIAGIHDGKEPSGEKIICGDADLMKEKGISVSSLPKSSLYVSVDGKAVGCVQIVNKTNESTKALIKSLKGLGRKVILLSDKAGDGLDTVCTEAGIDKCLHGVKDKNSALEKIKSGEHMIIYISDKTVYPKNADVKIAVSEASYKMPDKADVIITSDDSGAVASVLKQSKRAVNAVKFNTGLIMLVKAAAVVLAFLSLAPVYISVLSETIAVIICIAVTSGLGKTSKSKHTK